MASADLLQRYEHHVLATISRATARGYVRSVERFAGWCERLSTHVDTATGDDLARYLGERLQETNAKTGTPIMRRSVVNGSYTPLRNFYRWCIAQRLRADNPTDGLRPREERAVSQEPFSDEDVERLIAACRSPRERAVILLLLTTGLRAGELLRVRPEAVNWQTGLLTITGKGSHQRRVALAPGMLSVLSEYLGAGPTFSDPPPGATMGAREASGHYGISIAFLDRLLHRGAVAGVKERHPSNGQDAWRVDCASLARYMRGDGGLWRRDRTWAARPAGFAYPTLYRTVQQVALWAHVENAHPHRFRVTFANNFLRNGGDLQALQVLLGHSMIQTTAHYARWSAEERALDAQREMADALLSTKVERPVSHDATRRRSVTRGSQRRRRTLVRRAS